MVTKKTKKNDIEVKKENYCQHLPKEMLSALGKVVKRDDWIFAQDGELSHRSHLVHDFLKTKLKRHFIPAEEWSLSSPDVNPLDYFCWNFLKTKVYKGRSDKSIASETELKNKIKSA